MTDKGRLLYEYRGPRAHPIVYAGLILFGVVLVTGSVENVLRDNRSGVFFAYAAPFMATVLVYALGGPSPVHIHANGIAPARPMLWRWYRPFVRWDELTAVYPTYYDVTGAFVSPFASSDGKVTQMGLGLEWPDGRIETVRFTPSRFVAWRPRSEGFKGALAAVRYAFEAQGRPLVPEAETFTSRQRRAMEAEARAPFLPFFAIVFLFASAAPVLWVLAVPVGLPVAIALPLSLGAPLWVSLRSHRRSRRRNRILNRLSKAAEYEANTQTPPAAATASPASPTATASAEAP